MLVLQVNPNDYVLIGDNIMVKFVKDAKGNCKFAIDAPKEYNIVRGKLYEKELLEEMQQSGIV